ncbi:MAG: hypothetical protein EKK42_20220 [Pseudonocardiaceae bacterium]|nr:MAG: hypothetical protein EKK42_20220 [Pseudonocardiaceae bacterium]
MTVSARITELEQQTQAIQDELTKLKGLPVEPPVGEVVKFTKRIGNNDYSYAALHTEAGWYLTGLDNRKRDWSEVVAYMGGNDASYSETVPAGGWRMRLKFNPIPAAPTYMTFNTVAPDDVW